MRETKTLVSQYQSVSQVQSVVGGGVLPTQDTATFQSSCEGGKMKSILTILTAVVLLVLSFTFSSCKDCGKKKDDSAGLDIIKTSSNTTELAGGGGSSSGGLDTIPLKEIPGKHGGGGSSSGGLDTTKSAPKIYKGLILQESRDMLKKMVSKCVEASIAKDAVLAEVKIKDKLFFTKRKEVVNFEKANNKLDETKNLVTEVKNVANNDVRLAETIANPPDEDTRNNAMAINFLLIIAKKIEADAAQFVADAVYIKAGGVCAYDYLHNDVSHRAEANSLIAANDAQKNAQKAWYDAADEKVLEIVLNAWNEVGTSAPYNWSLEDSSNRFKDL
jgi:hypothetical protein